MTVAIVDVWRFDSSLSTSSEAIEDALALWAGTRGPTPRHAHDARRRPIVPDHPELSLSVSHSGTMTLVAIGERCRVGVDLEAVRERGIVALSRHALSMVEREELERRKGDSLVTLLSYWTRKEALLKAAGVGLAVEPYLIQLPPPGSTRVVALPPVQALGRPERWFVREFVIDGHIAAVAADVPSVELRRHVTPTPSLSSRAR